MSTWPVLSVITFLPLLGAVLIYFVRGSDEVVARNARFAALWTTIATFVISLFPVFGFEYGAPGFQFQESLPWLGGAIGYRMGVDGISLPFVVLTTFLMPLCILASWRSVRFRVREYMIAFLVLETLMVGVFCSLDLFLF
jgi:NADH-quinone oxidoreductase subunit M